MGENIIKRSRTKERLKTALISLCGKKAYYDITIQEICRQAGLYRSTFYRYYDTKDDMLREIEQEYIDDVRALTPNLWRLHSDSTSEEMEQYRKELTADLQYHLERKALSRFLMSPAGDIYFYNKVITSISSQVHRNYQYYGRPLEKKTEYVILYFAVGFISAIDRWLEKEDCSTEEITDLLLSLMLKIF